MSAKSNLESPSLFQFCTTMFRIGATGFGGPLVTLNLMREAYVKKHKWMTEKEFLERMGMLKLLPGPISSLMAIALGRKFFGKGGSLLALLMYIMPAFCIIMFWNFGESAVKGIVPAALADSIIWFLKFYIVYLILKASYKLMKDAWINFPVVPKWKLRIFSAVIFSALVLTYFERLEIEMLGFSLLVGLFFHRLMPVRDRLYSLTILGVFMLFFVASLVVFGTGYMLFPYIEREVVVAGLLTREAFDTGILLGNLSPGPVVIGATYYGWKLAGWGGAIAASIGIFFGPFVVMNLLYKSLERLRSKALVQYLSLCMIPVVVVVLLKFNWSLVRSQWFQAIELFALIY